MLCLCCCTLRLSLVAESRASSWLWCNRLLTAVQSLVAEHRLQVCRLQELQLTGPVTVVHGLSCPVACGIFPDQGSNPCPCIGRQILYHFTIRKALLHGFKHTRGISIQCSCSYWCLDGLFVMTSLKFFCHLVWLGFQSFSCTRKQYINILSYLFYSTICIQFQNNIYTTS